VQISVVEAKKISCFQHGNNCIRQTKIYKRTGTSEEEETSIISGDDAHSELPFTVTCIGIQKETNQSIRNNQSIRTDVTASEMNTGSDRTA
jgi:hypothetical protein